VVDKGLDLPHLDIWSIKILDIIFISYDEPNAEKNWRALRARFPHAQRVHHVKGIANAHIAACKKANTKFFYVVDGDAEILDTFKFNYKPPEYDAEYTHIWHAFNPAIGLDYGYGGVKLFNREFFKNVTSQLDFTTTLAKGIKIMDEIACITRFNSDQVRSFRGAFRETVKLYIVSTDSSKPANEIREARERLAAWLDPLQSCDYRQYVLAGALTGISEVKRRVAEGDTFYINDHELIVERLAGQYPELDLATDPQPKEDNPMKPELFFTTRIASAFYDPFVLENVKMEELRDALSDGQLLSKNWVAEVINDLIKEQKLPVEEGKPLRVAILGGWIGTLSLMLNTWELPLAITSVDLDERANRVAEKLNYGFNFVTMTVNMYDLNYENFDLIINTSSEHIPDIAKWRSRIPPNKFVMVQNNDFEEGNGHVSCVRNSAELRKQLKLAEVIYEGTRIFPQYSRFMLIGKT
jgi:hypothetical protein